mgnify:FL=1
MLRRIAGAEVRKGFNEMERYTGPLAPMRVRQLIRTRVRDVQDRLSEEQATRPPLNEHTEDDQINGLDNALSNDFPSLWNDPRTPSRERKRMVRLLVEDVTLIKDRGITAHIRFKGGATHTITLPTPPPLAQLRKNPAHLVARVDRLLDDYTHGQIAAILTHKGMRTVDGAPLGRLNIRHIQQAYGLVPRYERLRNRGMLTLSELAEQFGVCRATVKSWNQAGFLRSHLYKGTIQNIISQHILDGVHGVLVRKFAWDKDNAQDVIVWLRLVSEIVRPKQKVSAVSYDPDNRIIECAIAGKTTLIVTGDKKHLQPLKEYCGILIVGPDEFFEIFQRRS